MNRSSIFLIIVLLANCPVAAIFAAESQWVRTGVTGRLIYAPDAEGDRILDFTNVGYKGRGSELLPNDIPITITVTPVAGDDTATIQAAINQLAAMPIQANGYRGAVLLQAGDYDINTQLNINTSGIVLRGVGRDTNGTVLHARGTTQRALVNIVGSGSQSLTGSTYNMLDKVVPAGTNSFRLNSVTGLAVGQTVRVERPGTQAWVNAVGMGLPDGEDPAWNPTDFNIQHDRIITRIEGDRVFLDAPLATSFEQQFGGGTLRRYTWSGRIQNVGVENIRAESDYNPAEVSGSDLVDEDHAWTFVTINRAQNVWVRNSLSRYFGFAAVLADNDSKWVTVDNVVSEEPVSLVTGERRYAFDLDGQMAFVNNSSSDKGRHDFVNNGAADSIMNVFHNSTATNARSDSGPHRWWSTATLLDNITVQGNQINAQNRGTSGTRHGWSGANIVVWNSQASSYRVENPPTSQNWLVGSTGTIQSVPQPGNYDSHGTNVTAGGTDSLYDAQKNDAADIREFHWGGGVGNWSDPLRWEQGVTPAVYRLSSRDYLLGDIDGYTNDGAGSVDAAYIDPAWSTAIQNTSALPITGFDDAAGNKNVAFTIQHQLDAGERVVHGYLALGLKQTGGQVNTDFIRLFDMNANYRLDFASLGWDSKINSTSTFVGVIDLGSYLDQLQSGAVNVQINDDTAADWGMYVVTVAKPVADAVGPTVFLDSGGTSVVNSALTGLRTIQVGGVSSGILQVQALGTVQLGEDYIQLTNGSLSLELNASTLSHPIIQADGAKVDGALNVQLATGFLPGIGNEFHILDTLTGLEGEFDSVLLPDLTSGQAWNLVYNTSSVSLRVVLQGDYNRDNRVDAADYIVWRRSFNQVVTNGESADGNYDGVINTLDYNTWRANFGASAGAGASNAAVEVPEPMQIAILVIPAIAFAMRRRKSLSLRV